MTHVSWFIQYKIDAEYYTVVGEKIMPLEKPEVWKLENIL